MASTRETERSQTTGSNQARKRSRSLEVPSMDRDIVASCCYDTRQLVEVSAGVDRQCQFMLHRQHTYLSGCSTSYGTLRGVEPLQLSRWGG